MRTAVKDSPTKAKLLQAAQELVLSQGFVGTTVDDICKKTKVTKGSFFHYFDSKEELGVELLKCYCANTKQMLSSGCDCNEKDPLKRIYGLLDCLITMAKKSGGRGCLLGSMAQELAETHPEIRSICLKSFGELAHVLEAELKAAKAKHKPSGAVDPVSLAEHFVVVMQGSMLISKVRNSQTNGDGLRHYKEYLKTLFGK